MRIVLSRSRRITFSVMTLFIVLATLEGLCRLMEPPPASHVNFPPKAPGVFRVLVFGGAAFEQGGVPQLGVVSQYAAALRRLAPGRPLEVFGLGRIVQTSTVVREAVEYTMAARPDLLIIITGHDEFLPRAGERGGFLDSSAVLLSQTGIGRALERAVRYWTSDDDPVRLLPQPVIPYRRGTPWFEGRIATFRENMDAIVRVATERQTPLILCTAASNIADWPPVHQHLADSTRDPNYDENVQRIQALMDSGEYQRAEGQCDELLGRFGEDAMMIFLKGQSLWRLGKRQEARKLLEQARDMDPIPRRALSAFNDHVRGFNGKTGVEVVDLDRRLDAYATDGLPGEDLLGVGTYPTPKGGAAIVRELILAMARMGCVVSEGVDPGYPDSCLSTYLNELADRHGRAQLLARWHMLNGIGCAMPPYCNYAAARRALDRAGELTPKQALVWANVAGVSALQGDLEEAGVMLRRAEALSRGTVRAARRELAPYLDWTIEQVERSAAEHPD